MAFKKLSTIPEDARNERLMPKEMLLALNRKAFEMSLQVAKLTMQKDKLDSLKLVLVQEKSLP